MFKVLLDKKVIQLFSNFLTSCRNGDAESFAGTETLIAIPATDLIGIVVNERYDRALTSKIKEGDDISSIQEVLKNKENAIAYLYSCDIVTENRKRNHLPEYAEPTNAEVYDSMQNIIVNGRNGLPIEKRDLENVVFFTVAFLMEIMKTEQKNRS
ncbi:MAG: hypothetical protein FWC79_01685 [Oscillospiraceae bacterium]|nr:hypothetical protein [Oscillospiraceae bacterium]